VAGSGRGDTEVAPVDDGDTEVVAVDGSVDAVVAVDAPVDPFVDAELDATVDTELDVEGPDDVVGAMEQPASETPAAATEKETSTRDQASMAVLRPKFGHRAVTGDFNAADSLARAGRSSGKARVLCA